MINTALVDIGFEQEDFQSRALLRDLNVARPLVYWSDFLLSAGIGWTALGFTATTPSSSARLIGAPIAVFALYRALCFIHEISHVRRSALRGFETVWNLLAGFPLLMPSFIYVGVHPAHHSPATYGTSRDPEYLPFAASRGMTVVFALESVLMPAALMVRFLLIAPLGLLVPPFQRRLATHASALTMNFKYRRETTPELLAKIRRDSLLLLSMWAIGFTCLPLRIFLTWFGVVSVASFLNTLRTLAAHRYEGDGTPFDRAGQLRDSVDVPGRVWTALWAPVGLRFHALHHYFPGVPYHNLGIAHRRLTLALPPEAVYRSVSRSGLLVSLCALISGGPPSPQPKADQASARS